MLEYLSKCPKCGCERIAVQVITWANYENGAPVDFDDDEIDNVEAAPADNAVAVCHECQHQWHFNQDAT
jgi:hypothetical protein